MILSLQAAQGIVNMATRKYSENSRQRRQGWDALFVREKFEVLVDMGTTRHYSRKMRGKVDNAARHHIRQPFEA
jgi:hypothetical protein